ncbi:hypothetical protein TNCV_1088841 [Trichonephila clavipes]|uniref:Uncharacterized protein n=1 Tax=Trichonephila clavipes TaxID=2585209 RepID=A0A8X6VQ37_TRICX|nr:hypothetical protein TNCV_1088841 [Trichonephila clavipes]
MASGISLALQWILINGSEGYFCAPFRYPISLHFKDSVSIDTGLKNGSLKPMGVRYPTAGLHPCEVEILSKIRGVKKDPPDQNRVKGEYVENTERERLLAHK